MCKLAPEPAQRESLLATMEKFNAACDWISGVAFAERCAGKMRLQKLVYREVRARFGLSAQMAIRAIGKVCEVYKRDKSVRPVFAPRGAVPFDQRILSWKSDGEVSILTLGGRIRLKVKMGEFQRARLKAPRGQSDLVFR